MRAYYRDVAEALIVVDLQNDFTPGAPGGALAVPEGDAIVPHVNELARSGRFELVVATRDWHPPDHSQFDEQGGTWPVHCVQGTEGAELHPDLDRDAIDVILDKGQESGSDGYSGFEDTSLAETLRARGVDTVTVVGLATDVCVLNTARDALAEGFRVTLERAATRGIDLEEGDSERALEELRAAGAVIV
jgi:nicotinamidase/pyrazinamidase